MNDPTYNVTRPTATDGKNIAFQANSQGDLYVSQGTFQAGEDLLNDVLKVEQRALYLNGTATQLVKTGAGRLFGIIVNSHTSGTIKFWDNTAGSGAVLIDTFTFPAGSGFYVLPVAIQFSTGLYATVGGTLNFTIVYQ